MPSGLRALHAWLDTWHGIGLIEHGLAPGPRSLPHALPRPLGRVGVRDEVWSNIVQGSGWQMTPCEAVHQAAFQAAAPGSVLE